ncbi:MAG: tetratricopeptide repeat protein [Vicinamibacteria bacterium]|jgi:Tfp pilus assembly protein PilF|nr:tetratricopeptide repeat protein [Vicinamibacteria bacterium]
MTAWILLAAVAPAQRAASDAEVRFGIQVATRGLWREALFRFERAIVLNPENHAAYNNLGVAYEQQGELGKAREAYEKALKLKPRQVSIQQNFDLFREFSDKRGKKPAKTKSNNSPPASPPNPSPNPSPSPNP